MLTKVLDLFFVFYILFIFNYVLRENRKLQNNFFCAGSRDSDFLIFSTTAMPHQQKAKSSQKWPRNWASPNAAVHFPFPNPATADNFLLLHLMKGKPVILTYFRSSPTKCPNNLPSNVRMMIVKFDDLPQLPHYQNFISY